MGNTLQNLFPKRKINLFESESDLLNENNLKEDNII
jgi:hypothetical protein